MENVLKGFAKTFSLDCEKDKTATSTVFIPPFFTGVSPVYKNDLGFILV